MYTFNEIDFSIRSFDALQAQQAVAPLPEVTDHETALQRMFVYYRVGRPILMGIASAVQIFKPSWRAVNSAFVAAADVAANLNPPPTAPAAVAAASSDTTTTDPTSIDPSFKAGKDLGDDFLFQRGSGGGGLGAPPFLFFY
jgi:hypothetical protein